MSRRRLGFRSVRYPEPLETRTMLAGGGFVPFSFLAHRLVEAPTAGQSATQFVSSAAAGRSLAHDGAIASMGSHAGNHQHTTFTATLTDSAGTATGTATYSTHAVDGEVETTFSVTVTGATANSTFDVTVGDTIIGQITTDDTGAGALVLSSNPTGIEEALPADFPTDIGADTVVSVGTLSGSLAINTDSGDGEDGGCHHSSNQTSLETSLTDSDSTSTATGTASYQVDSESGDITFSVSVTGATASSTLDVAIDNTVVGQLTTDESGAGSLVLASNPTGTQQALPVDFPTSISAGSTVTVGTLSGTLASSSSLTSDLAYFGAHHFGRRS